MENSDTRCAAVVSPRNIVIKSKNKNLGKFDKKSIYLNHGKYGYFLNYNKLNYKIPEWLPPEKIDLEIASNLIEYKLKYQENKKKITMTQNKYIILMYGSYKRRT